MTSPSAPPPRRPEAADEARYYPNGPDFKTIVRPDAGHDSNLEFSAPQTTQLMREWLDRHR
jgi:hypothetical protein